MAEASSSHSSVRRRNARQSSVHEGSERKNKDDGSIARKATNGRRRPAARIGRKAERPSRLRFLLSILLVTTLMLVLLQTYRQVYKPRRSASSSAKTVLRSPFGLAVERLRRASTSSSAASKAMTSGEAIAAQRDRDQDGSDNPLSWPKYIAAMRQHFKDQLAVNDAKKQSERQTASTEGSSYVDDTGVSGIKGGGGMAIVPGQTVQSHDIDESELEPIPGKSREEALHDRRAALEELDQETLKAMFDALYGRGA